ncbi:MAG: esterase/lipase family protein [Pyrinomonadaceae bacterium]
MSKIKKAVFITFIILHSSFIISSTGCGARRTPDLGRIFAATKGRTGKPPIIVVPGILGSQLVNRKTGEVVWPSAFRSSDDGLALPISPDLTANRDGLVAERIIERAKLARIAPEVYVYYGLLRALRDYGGYREGDWDNPPEGGDRDTFYVFPFDWRRDNVETARDLARRIEDLKSKLNRSDLRFNVVAHSMGGLIARYAARYGDADLPPEGQPPQQVTWAGARGINKIFMFGVPNEGSAEALATLLEGYSVQEGLRRRLRLLNKLSREDAVTIPSIFQLLPHRQTTRFLDGELKEIAVDLYDPETWRRYGWSPLLDEEFRARFARGELRDESARLVLNGTRPETLDAYLAAVLARARRFHEALDVFPPVGASPVPLFAFGGDCEETLAAPVIYRDEKKGRWVTLVEPRELRAAGGRKLSRKEVTRAMYAPGDGRVTRRSILGEGLATVRNSQLIDTPLPITYAVFACDLHSDLQSNLNLQDNALTVLVNEVTKE